MSLIKEILRLILTTSLSDRDIARATGRSPTTINRYRHLAQSLSLTWEAVESRSEDELDHLLNRNPGRLVEKQHPNWTWVHDQMQLPGMALTLLWEDYRRSCPEQALAYSQFTHYYREHLRTLHPTMRQHHMPGEKVFVDFSGKRPSYVDQATGECITVELFVGTLGYSNRVFAMACPSQQLPNWIHAHVRMFEAFGGVPRIVVPDNLRSAVTKAGRAPIIQRTYQEMATHYDTVILPARPRRPRDKAKVEGSVRIVQRWVLLCLRHRQFFSLEELNEAIAERIEVLNRRPFKKLAGCRQDRFESAERMALLPLPATPFEYGEWTAAQVVPTDYHVHLAKHWYSVPFSYIGREVEGRIGVHHVEIYCSGVRIATHRSGVPDGTTTDPGHLPKEHRTYAERTPEHFVTWAEQIGPATLVIVKHQFDRRNPALGMPCCDRLQSLARQYGAVDFEAAAQRALALHSLSEKTMRALLVKRRPQAQGAVNDDASTALPNHDNIRGADYFDATKREGQA